MAAATEKQKKMFGDAIKAARLAKGWSGAQLGAELGVAQPTVSTWERGEQAPNDPTLPLRAEQVLDLPPGHLTRIFESPQRRNLSRSDVVAAIREDPDLDDEDREGVIRFYRSVVEMVRLRRAVSDGAPSKRSARRSARP